MRFVSWIMAVVSATLVGAIVYAGVEPHTKAMAGEPGPPLRAAEGGLEPGLQDALRRATLAASRDRIEMQVNSGWRSAADQERLLEEAIAKYGSRAAAARWVASPEKSEHVAGRAIDVGPAKAATWLANHGAAYGLCRVYRNEPWHFELRPSAPVNGCPRLYADPTQDPRLQS